MTKPVTTEIGKTTMVAVGKVKLRLVISAGVQCHLGVVLARNLTSQTNRPPKGDTSEGFILNLAEKSDFCIFPNHLILGISEIVEGRKCENSKC